MAKFGLPHHPGPEDPIRGHNTGISSVLYMQGYQPSTLYIRHFAVQERGYALIPIRTTAARIHAGAPLRPGSYGASVLNQNEQRNHCYLFVGTSKNFLAVSEFLVFPQNFLSSSAVQVTLNLAPSWGPVKRFGASLKDRKS